MRNFFTLLDFSTLQVSLAKTNGAPDIHTEGSTTPLVLIILASLGSVLVLVIVFVVAYRCCKAKKTQDEEDLMRSTLYEPQLDSIKMPTKAYPEVVTEVKDIFDK